MVPLSPVVAVMLVTMQSVYCANVTFSSGAKGTYSMYRDTHNLLETRLYKYADIQICRFTDAQTYIKLNGKVFLATER